MSNWQTIENAPKTRHAILVFCPERRNTYIVTWHPGYEGRDGGWSHFGGIGGPLRDMPTHWMPVPEAPTVVQTVVPT